VTVLFADVRGFTALAQQLAPEALVRQVNQFFQVTTETLLRHDACIDKLAGDQIMAVFGAPVVRPDHADQAVAAARAIQRDLGRLSAALGVTPRLEVGIGINTGEAVVGNVGSTYVKDFTAMGETVNLAAHLQQAAGPGEILVTQATLNALAAPVDGGVPRLVPVKGLPAPLTVHVLSAPGPA